MGLGYVPCAPGEGPDDLLASTFAIDVAGRACTAEASLTPLYDPQARRMRP